MLNGHADFMKIALISDTHNSRYGIEEVLGRLNVMDVHTIIHCGDMTSGETADLFKDFCIHHVWGNGDIDTLSIQFAIQECRPGSSTGEIYADRIDGKRIVALHGHNTNLLRTLSENGHYDYVFYGHTHRKRDETFGKTRVINPGAIGGAIRSTRSYCVLDFITGDLTEYPIG